MTSINILRYRQHFQRFFPVMRVFYPVINFLPYYDTLSPNFLLIKKQQRPARFRCLKTHGFLECQVLKKKYFFLRRKATKYICVISPIIDKRLYLTLFDLATTPWVFTIT